MTEKKLLAPPIPLSANGSKRRVGVEIEFAAVAARQGAYLVRKLYGGAVIQIDPHRFDIDGTEFGTFRVELDTQYAHPNERLGEITVEGRWLDGALEFLKSLDGEASELIADFSEGFVPCEIVTPPIEWDRLGELDNLFHGLRRLGAEGTDEGVLYAFGLQLNPEVPGTDCGSILDHLRAFLILEDWLRERVGTDLLRRMLPYIDPFPRSYALKVLDPGYAPDMDGLIDDYIEYNPTRNRDLDLLPLFTWIDSGRVRTQLDDIRIKSRPTFHYRLPDTRFTQENWDAVTEWNRWVAVEYLASRKDLLEEASRLYLDHFDGLLSSLLKSKRTWIEKSGEVARKCHPDLS